MVDFPGKLWHNVWYKIQHKLWHRREVLNMGDVRENRLRRQATRLGYMIRKSRGKLWSIDNQMGYLIVDASLNATVAGGKYDLSLDDVEEWLNDEEIRLRAQA